LAIDASYAVHKVLNTRDFSQMVYGFREKRAATNVAVGGGARTEEQESTR
jgi:hypothetical protein